jgi:hypothetical protein
MKGKVRKNEQNEKAAKTIQCYYKFDSNAGDDMKGGNKASEDAKWRRNRPNPSMETR